MILITIVNGVYKPTNITGGPHIVPFKHLDVNARMYYTYTNRNSNLLKVYVMTKKN